MPAHSTAVSPPSSRYQPMPRLIGRGSGGGSPDGRRRHPPGDAASNGVTSGPRAPDLGVGSVVIAAPPRGSAAPGCGGPAR